MIAISIRTRSRTGMQDVTSDVADAVSKSGVSDGVCFVCVPHTTAGVTINENADASVARDIDSTLAELVPFEGDYTHSEGNSAAHVKSVLVGTSQVLPVVAGELQLGTWQGIYFCEFDGPRSRKVWVQVVGQ